MKVYVGGMSTKVKKVNGRPTAFNSRAKEIAEMLSLKGLTDKEIAKVIGVTEQTFNNWKKKHPKFFESLRNWKAQADFVVERSLYERAQGYKLKEEKVVMVNGAPEKIITEREIPPDPTSMIFWLKNRNPKSWRDKVDLEHSGTTKLVILDD